ncbi:MAG: hypothetical protein HY791_29345 [Deltaproteobacteria bacterium]|nr:hypothetical protein [Deltaproteobacteria bacterium]
MSNHENAKVRLKILPEGPWTDAREAARWLASLTGEGWMYAPGTPVRKFVPRDVGDGPVLAAEVAISDVESVTFRFDGDRFSAWRFVEAEGYEFRRIRKEYESTVQGETGPGRMVYFVYWKPTTSHAFEVPEAEGPVAVLEPHAARFGGWSHS